MHALFEKGGYSLLASIKSSILENDNINMQFNILYCHIVCAQLRNEPMKTDFLITINNTSKS